MSGNHNVRKQSTKAYVNPQPFTCYFCKKYIENETEFGHLSICGSVLEPCSNKCGSYVPRSIKDRHLNDCLNKKSKNTSRVTFQDANTLTNFQSTSSSGMVANGTATLGRRRMISDSSTESQVNYKNELPEIKRNMQNLNQQLKLLSYNIENAKMKCKQDNQSYLQDSMQAQVNFEKIQYQCQILLDWKRNLDKLLENFKEDINRINRFRLEHENQLLTYHNKLLLLDKLDMEQKNQAEVFLREQINSREALNELTANINEVKKYFVQENAKMSGIWNERLNNTQRLQQEVEVIRKNLEDYEAKYNVLVFDTRTVTQISAETSEKLEIQEKTVSDVKKNVSQLTADFEALELRVYGEMVATKAGRFLWKLPDFSSKFQEAKNTDIVFKSPVFYSHEYGYKLRLNAYLNGLKKWKGRHMLACLQVLKGEYDDLLKWPCSIEGTVTMRDTQDVENPKNLTKLISAKRQQGNEENEDPHESSNQYIFIPHSTLLKDCYTKTDNLFIDFKMKKSILVSNGTDTT